MINMTKSIPNPDSEVQISDNNEISYNNDSSNDYDEKTSDVTRIQKIICPNCSAELPASFHFCKECGTKLEDHFPAHQKDVVICQECSAEVPAGTRFCTDCGAKIQSVLNVPRESSYQTIYCQECSTEVPAGNRFCTNCGTRVQPPMSGGYQEKNPFVAGGLSFIFAGVGQIYNGQITKGIILVVVSLICIILAGILYLFIWIFGMYDAYTTAQKINDGELVV